VKYAIAITRDRYRDNEHKTGFNKAGNVHVT